ncbi:MAG: hypothetical protein QOI66_1681 [Myxococcales bacterium]|nr:hypothetical protein [Myxococcales bacterium]
MKYRHVLSRRACLKAGGIAIGLPFLDCMLEKSVFGAPADAPVSVVSLMHGLGTPDVVLNRGYAGSLRYYQPLVDAKKVSIYTNIDMSAAADQPAVAQHHYGQPYLFSGFRTNIAAGFNVVPQGPSMQWAIMKQAYPQGSPTLFKVMDCGIYFRRGINYQYQRIYDAQGKNAADFEDLASPVDFFDNVFGKMPAPIMQDPKARASRSIIDYLVPAYQKYTGAGSPLPARDIAVLKNHLDRVRQLEQAVYGGVGQPPKTINVTRPMPPNLKYKIDGSSCGDPANVYRVSPKDFETAYQIMADLFVAGLQSDYYRFGNLSFDSGGGHTYFTGPGAYPDDANYVFNGNVHATYHMWNANNAGIVKIGTAHNFFCHRNLAQVLTKMDAKDFLGPNGKTVLDNTLVLVGSEVGTNHDVTRMFHGIAGGNGRFKMGLNSNDRIKAIELYSSLGKAYGMAKVGDGRDYKADDSSILT